MAVMRESMGCPLHALHWDQPRTRACALTELNCDFWVRRREWAVAVAVQPPAKVGLYFLRPLSSNSNCVCHLQLRIALRVLPSNVHTGMKGAWGSMWPRAGASENLWVRGEMISLLFSLSTVTFCPQVVFPGTFHKDLVGPCFGPWSLDPIACLGGTGAQRSRVLQVDHAGKSVRDSHETGLSGVFHPFRWFMWRPGPQTRLSSAVGSS